jgi:ribosomal protein L7/L12
LNIDWGLISSLLFNAAFLIIIFGQSKEIKILREKNQKLLSNENKDELIVLASEKLKTLGDIKTVKYLRLEKGMSMIDAKKLVDSLKE